MLEEGAGRHSAPTRHWQRAHRLVEASRVTTTNATSGVAAERHERRRSVSAEIRVLIVEDDSLDRLALCRMLQRAARASYRTEAVASAEEALSRLAAFAPDCLLVDMHLPRTSGLELVEAVRDRTGDAGPPVVVITGERGEGAGVAALKAGAADFLRKDDLGSDALERTIGFALEKCEAQRLRRRLDHSEKMGALGRIVAGIAHEINNPTSFALMAVELLQEQLEPAGSGEGITLPAEEVAAARELLEDCRDGIERIAAIVAELREFTRDDASGMTQTTLDEVVRRALRLTSAPLRALGEVTTSLEAPAVFLCDNVKLTQVVVNLILNAVQACSGRPGRIELRTRQLEDVVELTVADDGPGVPVERRARIFEPFFTSRSSEGGTGLGLSLSAEYVRRHGGAIEVTDGPLGGALFRVQLPLGLRSLSEMPQISGPRRRPPQGRRLRVLLVDDEPNILKLLKRSLGQHWHVVTAHNGREALDCLRLEPFDIVISDVSMPEMGGVELYQHVEREFPHLCQHYWFLSGGVLDEDTRAYLQNVFAERLLAKPLSAERLREIVVEAFQDGGLDLAP